MPWDVVVGTVVSVEVGVRAVVTVSIVDVTVSTVTACDLDGWIESEREGSVFGHQPVGFDSGCQENHRTVDLYKVCTDVWLCCSLFHDDWLRDGGQELARFEVADFKFALCGCDFLAESNSVHVEAVAHRKTDGLCHTEVRCDFIENWAFLDEEVLLDLCCINSVVESKAFCERVTNHVSTDLDVASCWFSMVRHRCGSCDIDGNEHWVQTSDDWIDELVWLDAYTVGNFCTECGCEDVLLHFPPFRCCHDVEVDVLKGPTVGKVVHWLIACELCNSAVLSEESLCVRLPHAQKFLSGIILIGCLFDGGWQLEEIVYFRDDLCIADSFGCGVVH